MCSVYINADPILYESRTRSLRINGVLTSIRLENQFWDVLSEMAAKEGRTTNQLITTLHEELSGLRGDSANFTSFLRVCCIRYFAVVQPREEALHPPSPAGKPVVALHAVKPAAPH
jgi:predicted DNA-binding ribbon-helix-helix protein